MPAELIQTSPKPSATKSGNIDSLTGLRGVAACLVMLYHFTVMALPEGAAANFIRKGYIWVDMFFVLSGFIMALNFSGPFTDGERRLWRPYGKFLVRRLARIYPLYVIVTLESAFAIAWHGNELPGMVGFRTAIAANIGMIQAWGVAPSFEGAAWSISTEWAAYLLFPWAAMLALGRSRGVAVGLYVVCSATVLSLAAWPGLHFQDQPRMGPLDIYSSATPAPLLRCLAEFCLGLLAYRSFRSIPALWDPRGRWTLALTLLLLGAMTIEDTDVIVVALFPFLVVGLARQNSIVSALLASSIPVWLGEISYSIYLLHGKFLIPLRFLGLGLRPLGRGAHPASVLLDMAIVCACAALTHRWIERSGREVVQRAFKAPRELLRPFGTMRSS